MRKTFKVQFVNQRAILDNIPTKSISLADMAPETGKALVFFIRPTKFASIIPCAIMDGDQGIGRLQGKYMIAYMADPGEHLFGVFVETADFMKADGF